METVNETTVEAKHPAKTSIGRIARGFDFLGYHFAPEGLSVAKATLGKFVERAARLYEQGLGGTQAPPGSGGTCAVGCSGSGRGWARRSAQLMARPTRLSTSGHRSLARLWHWLATAYP
jgi:hypothetical protein